MFASRLLCIGSVTLLFLSLAGRVAATPGGDDRAAQARAHFDEGNRRFAKGQLVEALAEYEAAQKIKPDPALLYDMAQTHRALGHAERALALYRGFLDVAPYAPNRDEVLGKIKSLEDEIARNDAERKALESKMAASEARAREAEARAVQAEAARRAVEDLAYFAHEKTMQAEAAEQAAKKAQDRVDLLLRASKPVPLHKRWWLWTAVGLVVAGGVVATIVLARPSIPSSTQGNFVF